MTSTESTEAKGHHHHHHSHHPPPTPVPSVACRMLRSPSHESVTTDLSLFSVSSLASDAAAAAAANSGGRGMRLVTFKSYSEAQLATRGPSPNPDSRGHVSSRPPDIPEVLWFEEENELIRSCAALSSALGLQKSFSTSDISQLPSPEEPPSLPPPRCAVSELALSAMQRSGFLLEHPHLDHASRSCSTWVAVGDVASTSQLPSPHGGHNSAAPAAPGAPSTAGAAAAAATAPAAPPSVAPAPAFTAADLIRSVNKKVRQNYIRRRLLTTYKALERLSQSEFNLDRLEVTPATAAASAAAVTASPAASAAVAAAAAVTTSAAAIPPAAAAAAAAADAGTGAGPAGAAAGATPGVPVTHLTVPGAPASAGAAVAAVAAAAASASSANCTSAAVLRVVKQRASKNLPLTIRDVERERGKPLSKYERNMMIFNWLHTLDDSFDGLQ